MNRIACQSVRSRNRRQEILCTQPLPRVCWFALSASLSLFAVSAASAETRSEEGITIESEYETRMLTWRIINESAAPIVHVRIPTYKTYDIVAPDTWHYEDSHSEMKAWAKSDADAIRAGRSLVLQVTGSSSGGTPGLTTAAVTLADGRVISIDSVPTFEKESWMTIALPPIVVSALIILLLILRRRSTSRRGPP